MSKLLILGGSNCQINAFRLARRRGLETVLFDYLSGPPAAELADEHRKISTFDHETCIAEARELGIDGVMTLGTDQPVYTAALLANELKLPSLLSPSVALSVTNKALMKKILTDNGIPTVPYRLVDKQALKNLDFSGPIVIKPLDSQGQKGVFRAESVSDAVDLFDRSIAFSRCRELLCEKYYESVEITVSAWVHRGIARILSVTDRVTFENNIHIGVCAAHRFPSLGAAGHRDTINRLTQQITDAFAIPEGPLYIQYLIGENGVVINELACRIGGAFEDLFIPHLTGFDILAAVMDAALGLPVTPPAPSDEPRESIRVLLPFAQTGTLAYLTPLEELLALDFVIGAGYNFKAGDLLPAFENAGARLGHIVITARDEPQMARNLERFYTVFRALDSGGGDMLLRREQ